MATDPFTRAPLRVLGYGYAIGVATRFRFCRDLRDSCFVVATSFLACHVVHSGVRPFCVGPTYISVVDTLIFESLATAMIPPVIVYYVCSCLRSYLKTHKHLPLSVSRWLSTCLGLALVPILYVYVDPCVIYLMDHTVRRLYKS